MGILWVHEVSWDPALQRFVEVSSPYRREHAAFFVEHPDIAGRRMAFGHSRPGKIMTAYNRSERHAVRRFPCHPGRAVHAKEGSVTVEGRAAGSAMTLVAWRVLWALLFAVALLSTAYSQLIPIHEWWGDGPDAIDRDMLFMVRFILQVAYIPTIISCALPVRSRTMRVLSVILGITIAMFLVRLPE